MDKAALAGAEFTLAPPEGSASEPVVLVTGADGTATFTLTEVGTCTLTETKAPAGYKLDGAEWKIETDRELASITKVTEGEGSEQATFWQWLYNLVFGEPVPTGFIAATGEKDASLTIENMPVENEKPDDGKQNETPTPTPGGNTSKPNTPTKHPIPATGVDTPKTGDTSNMMLWGSLLGISLAMMAGALAIRRRSRKS